MHHHNIAYSKFAAKILACADDEVCVGGFVAGDASCLEGYTGPRCATCDTLYFKDGLGACSTCDADGVVRLLCGGSHSNVWGSCGVA